MPQLDLTKRGRGIYLLPSLLTTGALFAGFYAIIEALKGNFPAAAVAVLVAIVLDGLDGRVARMTGTQSDFGAEFDSLSDMVSFGVAPALIIYAFSLSNGAIVSGQWGKLGWLACFLYAACSALRLARFNTNAGKTDKRFFQGLASPSAAAIVVSLVWLSHDLGLGGVGLWLASLVVTAAAGLLMVSSVPYYSFKELGSARKVPFVGILAVVLVFVAIWLDPPKVIFAGFAVYGLTGPAWWCYRRLTRLRRRSTALARGQGGDDADD